MSYSQSSNYLTRNQGYLLSTIEGGWLVMEAMYWSFPLCPSSSPLLVSLPLGISTTSTIFLGDYYLRGEHFFFGESSHPSCYPWCTRPTIHLDQSLNCILQLNEIIHFMVMTLMETKLLGLACLRRLSNRVWVPSLNFYELYIRTLFPNSLFLSVQGSISIKFGSGPYTLLFLYADLHLSLWSSMSNVPRSSIDSHGEEFFLIIKVSLCST